MTFAARAQVIVENKDMFKNIVFSKKEEDTSELLNEDNIKDLGN